MYVPKHHHWFFPVLLSLLGFGIYNRFPTWDGALTMIVMHVIASEWGAYLWQAGVMYQGYLTQMDIRHVAVTGKAPNDEMPTQASDEIPPVKVGGAPFETATALPKFDKEKSFAIAVLRMMEYSGKADMREDKWVNSRKFSRAEFVAMLKNWESYGLIRREAERRNASYIVANLEAVRLVANGNPLPRRDLVQ